MSNEMYDIWDSVKDVSYQRTLDDINDAIKKYGENTEEIVKYSLEKVNNILHAKSASFWLYHVADDGLIKLYTNVGENIFQDVSYLPEEGIIGNAASDGKAYTCDETSNNYKDYSDQLGIAFKTMICVPVVLNGTSFGCVLFIDKEDDTYFDERDYKLVKDLSDKIVEILKKRSLLSKYKDNKNEFNGKKGFACTLCARLANSKNKDDIKILDTELLLNIARTFGMYVSNIVTNNHGKLNRMMKDEMLAIWAIDEKDACYYACKTAVELNKNKAGIEKALRDKYGITLSFSIGIDAGEVYIGSFGEIEAFNNVAIGDSVLTASYISDFTPKDTIIVTENVYNNLDTNEFDIEEINYKGNKVYQINID